MNLIKFLIFGVLIASLFGEFGRFPFGTSSVAISVVDLTLMLNIICFAIWAITKKLPIFIPKLFSPLVIFWSVCIVSLIWSFRIFSFEQTLAGWMYLLRFTLYSSSFVLAYNLIKWQQDNHLFSSDKLLAIAGRVGIIFVVLGIIQIVIYPEFDLPKFALTAFGYDPHHGRLTSTFLDPNFAGTYLILILGTISYFLIKNKKKLFSIGFLVTLLAIVLTFSRSAYLMLLIFSLSQLILFWKFVTMRQKIVGVIIVSLFLISGILLSSRLQDRIIGGFKIDTSASERITSWKNSYTIFEQNPLIGVGFNNYRIASTKLNLQKTYTIDGGHAGSGSDSSLLLVLATTGIIGLAAFLWFWGGVIKELLNKSTLWEKVLAGLTIALLVNSQFVNSLFYPHIMVWMFVVLGMTLGEKRLSVK